jgi:glycosyltransferase involved in cell wall biosynthesis
MPFFSVIIPTYNRATMLEATLLTVLAQDFDDFEVWIIDDGSTDHTPQMMGEKFANHPKINYLQKKNEERSIARNVGMKNSKGQFAVFFDSDDAMHPHYLNTLHCAIGQHPECNFFACHRQFSHNGVIRFNETAQLKTGFYDYKLLLKGSVFGTVVCVRLNNPKLLPFPPEFNIFEDWIFNICNLRHDKLFFIDKVSMTIYEHPQQTMQNNRKAIAARERATAYLLPKLDLTTQETNIFLGYGHLFCAIHAYLEGETRQALSFWVQAYKKVGFSIKNMLLLAKILVGKKY